jgi:hypothetical protein
MTCENCQELLSGWLDNDLAAATRITLGAHLAACGSCRAVHDELDSVLNFCVAQRGNYDAVPNEEALWRRISNMIAAEQPVAAPVTLPAAGWRTRLRESLSLPQLAGSLAALVLTVSVMAVGMAKLPGAVRGLVGGNAPESVVAAGDRLQSLMNTRQPKLDYWLERVEARKARWSPQMRQNFEYNLSVLDSAVKESSEVLLANPHDAVSEERLNVVLADKMELLQEFATR